MHGRMFLVRSTEHTFGFFGFVRRPDITDLENRKHDAFEITQRDTLTGLDRRGKFLANVESNRHRPQHTRCKAH